MVSTGIGFEMTGLSKTRLRVIAVDEYSNAEHWGVGAR